MTEKFTALDRDGWPEFSMNKNPKCPHCGEDFDITDNEAWFLYAEDTHDVECPSCAGVFQVNSTATWYFSTDEQERDDD